MSTPKEPGSEVLDPYFPQNGLWYPPSAIKHREDEYPSDGFSTLRRMQARHFWYRGRHRFLMHAVKRFLPTLSRTEGLRVIDLGAGCGGWVSEFLRRFDLSHAEVAIGDSSITALQYASEVLPFVVRCYRVDCLDLQWQNRWDLVFLLDVLEHIPEDVRALREIHRALAPGGLLFITAPALSCFWTWNDQLVGHQRRYSRADFGWLAHQSGLRLRDARYFMFFLSPLLVAARWLSHLRVRRAGCRTSASDACLRAARVASTKPCIACRTRLLMHCSAPSSPARPHSAIGLAFPGERPFSVYSKGPTWIASKPRRRRDSTSTKSTRSDPGAGLMCYDPT